MLPFGDNDVGNPRHNGSLDKTRIASYSCLSMHRETACEHTQEPELPASPRVPGASIHGETHLFINIYLLLAHRMKAQNGSLSGVRELGGKLATQRGSPFSRPDSCARSLYHGSQVVFAGHGRRFESARFLWLLLLPTSSPPPKV